MTLVRPLRVDARVDRLAEVRAYVRSTAAGLGADEAAIGQLVQAADEWATNVAVHGYGGAGGPLEVDVERDAEGILVRIRDAAPSFDPATAPPFDPSVPLERRRLGGMGIHLVRACTDRLVHRALPGGGNEVTMHVAMARTGGEA